MFPSRSRAAASVLAGDVLLLPERRRAQKPGQLVLEDVELEVVQAPAVRLARRDQAGQRAVERSGSRWRGGGRSTSAPRPAGSPTACSSGARARGRGRRRLRRARLEAALRPARDGDRARATRARCAPIELPYAPDLIVIDVSFISLAKVLPAVLACAAERFDCLGAGQAAVRGRARTGRQGRRGARRPRPRGERAGRRRGGRARARAHPCSATRARGCPGRRATSRRSCWLAEAAAGSGGRDRAGRARGRAMNPDPDGHRAHPPAAGGDATGDRRAGRDRATGRRDVLRLDPEETRKHGLEHAPGLEVDVDGPLDVDICFALGGDGTILTALRTYAGTGVPVFAVNFGEIGFLATVDRDEARSGLRAGASRGDFEVLSLPGIAVAGAERRVARDQRRVDAPPARQARGRPRVCGRRGRDRARALRRPGRWPRRRGRPATTSPTAGR